MQERQDRAGELILVIIRQPLELKLQQDKNGGGMKMQQNEKTGRNKRAAGVNLPENKNARNKK